MPRQYESIRESFVKKGYALSSAKTHAAKIYNWMRGKHPSIPKLSNKHKNNQYE